MLILNEENNPIDLNLIPDQCDLYFWVFDNSTGFKDYFCVPLLMLESFYSPTIKLRLTTNKSRKNEKNYFLNVPSDYQILIGEPTCGDLEINPITSISSRHFNAFSVNPMSSFTADYLHLEVEDVLPAVKWFMPKTKTGQLLCIPLENCHRPECIYLVREMPKSLEIIQSSNAW
jgi:hypothetical protein